MKTAFPMAALSVLLSGLLTPACGGDAGESLAEQPPADQGSEGGACYPNSTCNAGLVCRSNLCVNGGSGGSSGAGPEAGPDGTAGTAGEQAGGSAGESSGGAAGSAGSGGVAGSSGTAGSGGAVDAGVGGAAGTGGNPQCPTPGDSCPGVEIPLTGTGPNPRVGSVTASTAGLCGEYEGSCSSGAAPDSVYFVVPDVDGMMVVSIAEATFDTVLYARVSCSNPDAELACSDKPPSEQEYLTITAYKGNKYHLFVDGKGGVGGTFTLSVAVQPFVCGDGKISDGEQCDDGNSLPNDGCSPTCQLEPAPANDKCPGSQIVLTGSGDALRVGKAIGSTFSSTDDYAGTCGFANPAKDLVYWFQSDVSGLAQIDLGGSAVTQFNSLLYARTTCAQGSSELTCNDAYTDGADKLEFLAAANTAYYVFVDGNGESGSFELNVKVIPPFCGNGVLDGSEACDDGNKNAGDGCSPTCSFEAPPANDKCPGTVVTLTGTGSNPRIGSVQGSTYSSLDDYAGQPYCGSSGGKDVVYSFTPDISGLAEIDLGGSTTTPFGAVLYAQTTCGMGSTELVCDDSSADGADKIFFAALAGSTYYVIVDGDGSIESGPFTLNVKVTPPSCGNGKVESPEECDDGNTVNNDLCDNLCKFVSSGPGDTCPGIALTLTQNGSVWEATAKGSTATGFAHQYKGTCASSSTSPEVVYQLNSGPGGKVTVALTAGVTSYDSTLYVRSGDCSAGTQIDCDDAIGDGGETISFEAAANTSYWIFVDGYGGEKGNYELKVSAAPAACGNGVLEGAEACDDGNTANNDGCSSTCTWEGQCGGMAEVEPNDLPNAQVIPEACGSFIIQPAALPTGDGDYFKLNLAGGSTFSASTFVGTPGKCGTGNDTVLSLWKASAVIPNTVSGGCPTSGYELCNDQDSTNSPCSKIGPYVVSNASAGEFILKATNYSSATSIPSYGILVTIH